MKTYFVYILSNSSGTLYIGITNDLERRLSEHRGKLINGFTTNYNLTKLVWLGEFRDVAAAFAREKQLKGWRRSKKMNLILSLNPKLVNLFLSTDPSTSSG